MEVFFGKDDLRADVIEVEIKLRTHMDSEQVGSIDRNVIRLIQVAVFNIIKNPKHFDLYCVFNISKIGDKFVASIKGFDAGDALGVEVLFSCCYRFLVEFQVTFPGEVGLDIKEAVYNASANDLVLSHDAFQEVRYANHNMVVNIVRGYLHHPEMISLKQLPRLLERAKDERNEYERSYSERKQEVDVLHQALEKYRDAFNFVGLQEGFSNLKDSKVKEKNNSVILLCALMVFMLLPFVVKFVMLMLPGDKVSQGYDFYFVLLGFELLMVYVFKVVLQNFRAVQSQLLQIDLRMTLCQFVQSYAEYAKKIKDGSPDLLSRFEQVVFSGIVNSDDAMPSTFDGLDQLSKLVSSFKKV